MLDRAGAVLLDTSFFMHLLDASKQWNGHAHRYMECFMESNWTMYLSTIVIAEWCVKGNIDELPLDNTQFLPFSVAHAELAGKYTAIALQNRPPSPTPGHRIIVKNDTKLMAQAEFKTDITHYLSSDSASEGEVYQRLVQAGINPRFKFTSLCLPPEQTLPMRRPSIPPIAQHSLFSTGDSNGTQI